MTLSCFQTLFWVSLGLLVYTYAAYPVLLWLFAPLFRFRSRFDEGQTPAVALLIAAHNEQDVIAQKIDNALKLDYPSHRIEIWIGTDACTDRTDEILSGYGNKIRVVRFSVRQGKSAILNQLVERTSAEIIIFSDANTFFAPEAVRKLVRHFADSRIGGVCGRLTLQGETPSVLGQWEKGYWEFESRVKALEGKVGRVMGANGAIYAIRRKLYRPIPLDRLLMDDFFITLSVLTAGYRVIFEPWAKASESTSALDKGEYSRKVRIARANFNFLWLRPGIFTMRDIGLGLLFTSHKLIRWFAPFLLISALISNLVVVRTGMIYATAFGCQITLYLIALLGALLRKRMRFLAGIYYFVSMNAAMLAGFFQSLKRQQPAAWKRVERI